MPITRLGLYGGPGIPYATFAGKEAAAPPPPPPSPVEVVAPLSGGVGRVTRQLIGIPILEVSPEPLFLHLWGYATANLLLEARPQPLLLRLALPMALELGTIVEIKAERLRLRFQGKASLPQIELAEHRLEREIQSLRIQVQEQEERWLLGL